MSSSAMSGCGSFPVDITKWRPNASKVALPEAAQSDNASEPGPDSS